MKLETKYRIVVRLWDYWHSKHHHINKDIMVVRWKVVQLFLRRIAKWHDVMGMVLDPIGRIIKYWLPAMLNPFHCMSSNRGIYPKWWATRTEHFCDYLYDKMHWWEEELEDRKE